MIHARAVLAGLLLCSGGAQAAGFALIEQNASGLGNAYAGQGAVAEDASTIFFNPAGLTKLPGRQLVLAGNFIRPSAKFDDQGSSAALLQAGGGEGGDAGGLGFSPNFYYAMDIQPDLKFGLGVNAPFGLKTEYDRDWIGRFHAVTSDLMTVNVNPTLAWRVNDRWSAGIGLDAQYIHAKLTNMTNYSALIYQATGNPVAGVEGLARVKGDDWSWGYNLGVLFEPVKDTRVGLSYRSRVKYTLDGTVAFSDRPALLEPYLPDGDVTAKVTLPDSWSLSLFHKLSERIDLLADVTWTHWALFKDLTVVRDGGTVLSTTPEHWDNVWRYSVGLNYHASDALTWRFGVAFDQSPVSESYRTPRIPDEDRTWLALGMQYRFAKYGRVDVGYAHLFVPDAPINGGSLGTGYLVGEYDDAVDIFSLQYTHTF
ncbi:transporter [Parasulfuritortus cantonensis]|uniref:Transporter n=1 Tax=Parasulfuritortus cantonensis TaxID=2528202 RepID=A0A4V6NB09_9PROT|nr:outer membrane protein transport protein [Parasulfuritortus cantonensis]TCJ15992.1 transporter [Parasulfuritortus cantonensis]